MSHKYMDLLLNDAIKTATYFLEKRGEFYPFAVVQTNRGEIRHIQAMMKDSRPQSTAVLQLLKSSLAEGCASGGYEAVAIVSSVELDDRETGKKSDAISVQLDDKSSNPVLCYIPYYLKDGLVQLEEVIAGTAERIALL